MSEPLFFKRGHGLALTEVVQIAGARPRQRIPVDLQITDVAALDRAGPGDITFAEVGSKEVLQSTQATACFTRDELVDWVPMTVLALVVDNPYHAFIKVAAKLYPEALRPSSLFEVRGTAVSALVHSTARIEAGVTIDPAAMIGPRAEIGAGTVVEPMAVIGPDVRIGRDCLIGAGVSVTNALIGDHVVLRPGCRIGQPAILDRKEEHAPQLGRVILQDRVEVGANSAVDRGRYGDSIIGEGTLIDALVQVPGDAMIGRYCRISAGRGLNPASSYKDVRAFVDDQQLFVS